MFYFIMFFSSNFFFVTDFDSIPSLREQIPLYGKRRPEIYAQK